ncbi:MAG: C39 family peptidase [Anaerolineae bacterium]|nr:C39 family peptidase [Anaerolineae bacterium]
MSSEVAPKLNKKFQKSLKYPLPEWHVCQGNSNDCGPFSATIVANALRNGAVVDAQKLARAMEEAPKEPGFTLPARMKGWATFPWGIVYALRSFGFEARWKIGASLRHLKENLDNGLTTIVIVGDPLRFDNGKWAGWAHYKVLYAWDPMQGWAFVDPAASTAEVFSYQDDASFQEQWTWMGRHVIEVWLKD